MTDMKQQMTSPELSALGTNVFSMTQYTKCLKRISKGQRIARGFEVLSVDHECPDYR